MKRIILAAIAWALVVSPIAAAWAAEGSPAARPIILLHEGKRYVLNYWGDKSNNEYEELPENIYLKLNAWCINAAHAGILSELNLYKITARLATVEQRSEWGFSINPDAFGFWRRCGWVGPAANAVYTITDNFPNDSRLENIIVRPLINLGIADRDKVLAIYLKENKCLTSENRAKLVNIFKAIENEFSGELAGVIKSNKPNINSINLLNTFKIEN